jgi:hypothetical protein
MSYTLTNLGVGIARDINNAGRVVGNSPDGGWYWDGQKRITLKFRAVEKGQPPETGLFFTANSATRIADDGGVFGDVMFIPRDPTSARQYSWRAGPTADRADLVGSGAGPATTRLSSAAQTLGNVMTPTGEKHAALTENGVHHDLNFQVQAPGWILEEACAINERGQIVGGGRLNGLQQAFLLTPVASTVAEIESYAGFYITGLAGKRVAIMAGDPDWNGEWRKLAELVVPVDRHLWIDQSTPRRRAREYRVQAL